PVYIGRRRPAAARVLLAAHPDTDVIVADDGLQHYALGRDLEIAVVDGVRRFGNGWLLPAGPLRELPRRLDTVDAVVVNGGTTDWLRVASPVYPMRLTPVRLRRLCDPEDVRGLDWLRGRRLDAVAGIGHPERFFELLRELGAVVTPHPFPDHHGFRPQDLPAGTVVMTEKDAVKCAAFARADDWLLEVDAVVDPALHTRILNRLPPPRHGRQTA
ncbi:MAG: tetraacyldisaccharide 4'-kinase, partial [Thiobacillaceae bacterium]